MEFQNIIYKVEDGIATIQLNRPKALNALNSEINRDIMEAINLVKADPSVRVLIMTGDQRACRRRRRQGRWPRPIPVTPASSAVWPSTSTTSWSPCPSPPSRPWAASPSAAAVNDAGLRLPGGRLPHHAVLPEVGLGIIPGANGCASRHRHCRSRQGCQQLVMLTEMIPGKQAYDLGLLNWLVEGRR